MLAILSSVDEGQRNVTNKDVSFIHIISSKDDDIEIEARPVAHALAKQLNIEKVYLFYGEKGKIVYDFPL